MKLVLALAMFASLLLTGCPPQRGMPPVTASEVAR